MKNRANKIVISALLVFCMAFSVFFATVKAEAADTVCTEHTTYKVKAFPGAEVANYRKTKPYQAPEVEKGYLFAGWYSNENCTVAVRDGDEIDPDGTYYAKGVPEHMADVKAQLSTNLTQPDGEKTSGKIRFVTTVDSLAYQQAGFYISYNGKTIQNTSDTVYDKLVATDIDGKSDPIDPHVFCGISRYFRACTIKNVTNKSYSVQFDVQAFWITLDGTQVRGPEVRKQVKDGLLRDVKYVALTGNDSYAGTEESPYKTLETAIANVPAYGKIVILDTCSATIEEKNYPIPAVGDTPESVQTEQAVTIADSDGMTDKHLTITGGTLDFTGASEIHLGDSVKFENITLTFGENTSLYANGYTLEIAESATLSEYSAGSDHSKNLTVYGGSRDAVIQGNTNLILCAGTYANIYGGGHISVPGNNNLSGRVRGNTNIVISGTVNGGKTYGSDHAISNGLNLYGGGATSGAAILGNTDITIESSSNNFQYIFGGSKQSPVTGTTNVDFRSGTAMSIFGGGYYGETRGETHVTMTGGKVEQVFGGAQFAKATADTNVQILGGKVTRRIYGGCYNETDLSTWDSSYSVTGHSNVMISPNADISLSGLDANICAVSRCKENSANEWGTFIFNANATFSNEIGTLGNGKTHHYMVTTNGNTTTDSLGTVSPQGKYIHIEPKVGYSATVYQGTDHTGAELHYTESESIFELPVLSASTECMSIYVEFAIKTDKTSYAAKTGQAYYPTLEEAVDIAHEMYANRDKKVAGDTIVVTLLSDVEVAATLNIKDNANITLTNDAAVRTIYRDSGLSDARWIDVEKGATLRVEGLTVDGRTKAEALANTTVASSAGSLYELIKNSGTLTCEHVTFQNIYHKTSDADDTKKGCVLYGTAASNMTVTDCAFNDNYTENSGTALFVDGGSKAIITDSKFDGNAAPSGSGGAIYNYAATLETANCEFINNTSKNNGGAVYLAKVVSATVSDTSFSGGTATNGGGVMVDSCDVTLNRCTFKDSNVTGTTGVAMYVRGNSVTTINNGIFKNNTGDKNGGAIHIFGNADGKPTVNINDTDFSENKTSGTWGGAIYVSNATTNITNTNFTSNYAKLNGGAIGTDKASVVKVSANKEGRGIFFDNHVGNKGGAIATTLGSATSDEVFDIQLTGVTFDANYSAKDGGAILGGPGTKLTVDSCEFKNNYSDGTASGAGGAISINGNTKATNGYNASLEVTGNTTFTENKANSTEPSLPDTPAGYGGAIYVGYAQADITGATFNNNQATNGGAIGSNAKASITVNAGTDGTVTFTGNNTTTGNGGAINVTGIAPDATATYTTFLTVQGNTDFTANKATLNYGGAIYVGNATATITDANFSTNTALYGGAIGSVEKSNITVENADFTTNHGTGQGGAIRTHLDGATVGTFTVQLTGCMFDRNDAKGRGGAIQAGCGTELMVSSCDFKGNKTTGSTQYQGGGAIAVIGTDTIECAATIRGTRFSTNESSARGGAIESLYTDLTVTDSDFISNNAKNGAGGAIFAGGSGTVNISSTNGSRFDGNTATGNGEAICQASPVIMTVDGYTFAKNGEEPDTTEYNVVYFGAVTTGSSVQKCNFASGQTINKTNWNAAYGNNFDWTATE